MKKTIILSIAAISMLGIFSCSKKKNDAPATTASVMFVNGCAGQATVGVQVNNVNENGASSINFLSNSGYQSVNAVSSVTMAFIASGINTTLVSANASLTTSAHYSAFAGGIPTSPIFLLATDDLTAPPSGMAKVRLVNLATQALHANLSIGSPTIDSNVAYGTCTGFTNVTAGAFKVVALDPTNGATVATITSQSFSAGGTYTIIYTGTTSGTGSNAMMLTVIKNQ